MNELELKEWFASPHMSLYREKVLEHIFIAELLQECAFKREEKYRAVWMGAWAVPIEWEWIFDSPLEADQSPLCRPVPAAANPFPLEPDEWKGWRDVIEAVPQRSDLTPLSTIRPVTYLSAPARTSRSRRFACVIETSLPRNPYRSACRFTSRGSQLC